MRLKNEIDQDMLKKQVMTQATEIGLNSMNYKSY